MNPINIYNIMMNQQESLLHYKLVIVGDGGVGKTTLVHRFLTGEFNKKYVPTLGVDNCNLQFNTNYGYITFHIWDTAGQEKFSGLSDGYAIGADAVMGICDVTSKISAENLDWWYNKMNKGNVPSVACGNKFDIHYSKHKVSELKKIDIMNKWGMYYNISAKSNHDFEKPFLYLARILTGNNDLVFIQHLPLEPPTVSAY
jgi:GTP-binding nuclear protein Ran